MSNGIQFPVLYDQPYHGLIFENGSGEEIVIWVAVNGERHILPTIAPGESLLPIPIPEGIRVEWMATPAREITDNSETSYVDPNEAWISWSDCGMAGYPPMCTRDARQAHKDHLPLSITGSGNDKVGLLLRSD